MPDRVATIVHSVLAAVAVIALVAWQASLINDWIVGLVAIVCVLGSFAVLKGVDRRYREYVFEPLTPRDVSAEVRRHFERHTPALEQLGFERIGDFRFLPPPIAEVARVMISGDGECFATVSEYADTRYVSFTSMTTDGVLFESATLPPTGDGPSPSVPLRLQYLGKRSLDDGYQRHRRFLRDYQSRHGVEAVVCGPEDFRHVFEYGHRLVGWDLYQKGRRKTAPPPLPDVFSQQKRAAGVDEPVTPNA